MLAQTPKPPYYAVIFTSQRKSGDHGYKEAATRMLELACQQRGFLGVESAREDIGITVSYWQDMDAIQAWKILPNIQLSAKKVVIFGIRHLKLGFVK